MGGGDESDRMLMEALAERGHEVRVVTRVEQFGPAGHARLVRDLAERDVAVEDGVDKSNRVLMEALAERGDEVRVVTRVDQFGPEGHARLVRDLAARDVAVEGGVDVRALTLARLRHRRASS